MIMEAAENETEGLLIQLIHDLCNKGAYGPYQTLDEADKRIELLFERVEVREHRVVKRERKFWMT